MSLHHQDWLKILAGAALAATGAGAAGVGPLAGMLGGAGAGAGAGAGTAGTIGATEILGSGGLLSGAGTAATGGGFGSLIAPSLIGQGASLGFSGLSGTPKTEMKSPVGVPQLDSTPDPFAILQTIQQMKGRKL